MYFANQSNQSLRVRVVHRYVKLNAKLQIVEKIIANVNFCLRTLRSYICFGLACDCPP